jgi:hypothetical protein
VVFSLDLLYAFVMRIQKLSLCLLMCLSFACLKQKIIDRKNEKAIQTQTPLISQTPLPKEHPTPSSFPYELWESVLTRVVDERGLVDYKRLQQDRADFDLFVAHINRYSPKTNPELFPTREAKLAYYINAFNTSTFLLMLSRYPIKDIYDMRAEFFVGTVFVLGGEKYTLNSLETLMREEFKEPRVHFVLNCAALGDPRLQQKTIKPDNAEVFLEEAAKFYLSEPRNVKIVDDKTVELSSMFDLYGNDFTDFLSEEGDPKPSLITYINRYREEKLPASARLKFVPYDWKPNDKAQQ